MEDKNPKLTTSYIKGPEPPRKALAWKTIPEVLEYRAENHPGKEAIVFVSADGKREAVTFRELLEKTRIVARNLITLGVKPKEVVAINLRSCPEWLYICYGAIMAGGIPLGCSFTYKDGSDLVALMKKLEVCSCLVTDPGFENENWNILSNVIGDYSPDGRVTSERMPYLRYFLCHDPENTVSDSDVKPLAELLIDTEPYPDYPALHEDDLAGLFQTSGSTGSPKLVSHSHASLLSICQMSTDAINNESITFNERPMCWMGGYPYGVLIGQTRVTLSGFGPVPENRLRFLVDVVKQEKADLMFALPSSLHELLTMDDLGENWPVKLILTGGQPITKAMISGAGKICEGMLIGYGGSEALGGTTAVVTAGDVATFRDGWSGPVLPGVEIKVVDADERVVPVDTTGEIYIRSGGVFRGYYNDPDKTAAVFTDDGWYRTDDLGRLLGDGTLVVEGRKSNMIISGGMNVSPEILEMLIGKCPGVEYAVVVPMSDEVMYQVICACVKVIPGSDVGEAEVKKFCEDAHGDGLGLFTVLPKYYLFLDSFPELLTGKIARKQLIALAEKTFKPSTPK